MNKICLNETKQSCLIKNHDIITLIVYCAHIELPMKYNNYSYINSHMVGMLAASQFHHDIIFNPLHYSSLNMYINSFTYL